MSVKKISENVSCIASELHHNDMLFEGIWNVPSGVMINAYVISGEKNILIDGTLSDSDSGNDFMNDLKALNLKLSDIDILILNHLEPDHSGFILEAVKQNPKLEIYSTKKGIAFIKNFFKIENNLNEVSDGETLKIGENDGTIRFFEAPNVHWPETMMSYYEEQKILFSCDCFGGYGALHGKLLDSEHSEESIKKYDYEALRYYSNIMASFNTFILRAIDKVPSDVTIICPSHGIIWKDNAGHIINLYKKLASYGNDVDFEKEVCVVWASMYGYTKQGVDAVIKGLKNKAVKYSVLQIPKTPSTYVLADAYKAKALVLAMPTYEYKMFPPMAHILDLFERKHFYKKNVLRIGSWGWSGGAEREYLTKIEKLKWNSLPSYEWQGVPTKEDIAELEKLGEQLADTL